MKKTELQFLNGLPLLLITCVALTFPHPKNIYMFYAYTFIIGLKCLIQDYMVFKKERYNNPHKIYVYEQLFKELVELNDQGYRPTHTILSRTKVIPNFYSEKPNITFESGIKFTKLYCNNLQPYFKYKSMYPQYFNN